MREPIFIPESKALMDAFKDLKRTKNHLAVVIDEYGGTAGIVTMEDALEEIVGDIQDEFDSEEAEVLKIDEETYMISGSMNIDDFRELFGVDDWTDSEEEEEEEDVVDTVGGWITQQLGEIPEVGQKLTHGPLHIEVTKVSRHRIERLKVIRQPPPPEETSEEAAAPT
jgi:putative hemolysin